MSRAGNDRYAIEQTLLGQLRAAQRAYYSTAAEHKRASEARVGGTAADLDSNQHLHVLAFAEHRALRKYTLAVRAFADVVLQPRESVAKSESPAALTPRETQVVTLIAQGLSSRLVATQLDISFKTVVCHRYRLMQKLGVRNVAGLVKYAISRGIIAVSVSETSQGPRQPGSSSSGTMPSITKLR